MINARFQKYAYRREYPANHVNTKYKISPYITFVIRAYNKYLIILLILFDIAFLILLI
jgi:hypothetical protein